MYDHKESSGSEDAITEADIPGDKDKKIHIKKSQTDFTYHKMTRR